MIARLMIVRPRCRRFCPVIGPLRQNSARKKALLLYKSDSKCGVMKWGANAQAHQLYEDIKLTTGGSYASSKRGQRYDRAHTSPLRLDRLLRLRGVIKSVFSLTFNRSVEIMLCKWIKLRNRKSIISHKLKKLLSVGNVERKFLQIYFSELKFKNLTFIFKSKTINLSILFFYIFIQI